MRAALTYVYCLVRAPRRPSLRGVPAAMPGGEAVRLLDAGDTTWLVVSSVPEHDYGEAALERGLQNLDWVGRRALAHEAVVEHFLDAPALLPMQLFALFTADERAVAHVARDRRRINRILDRVERQHEWGLRLTWDGTAAREKVEAAHGAGKASGAGRASGKAYLARKRDLLDVNRSQLVAARAEANRLYRAMSREATAARRRTETEKAAAGSRLLLDAAFLVPVKRASAFRAALRRNARKLEGSGVAVALTGPWPAYNFI
ncbi:MAG TPA: GvpL/GvpF family gas vesicle protein [Albitalea sp.]